MIARGEPQEALKFFEDGLKHYPHVALLRLGRAKAQAHLGQYSSALLEYQAFVHGLKGSEREAADILLKEFREYLQEVKSAL